MSIYSLVVHTRPEDIQSVSTALEEKQGVEVHGANKKGKIVVSLEHSDRGYCSDTIMSFHAIDGVLNSSLIYEYFIDDKDSDTTTESRQTTTTEAS
jgi:nitrate reductase NapD